MSPKRRGKGGKGAGKKRRDPEAEARLREVEQLLEEKGVPVRYDSRLDGRGGLCRVHGSARVILNGSLLPAEKVQAILEVLEEMSEEAEPDADLDEPDAPPEETGPLPA